jgi:hypothetical protein
MLDPRLDLDRLIQQFLNGQLPFEQFQAAYSTRYVDQNADRDFGPEDIEYYGGVHEQAEWTTSNPPADERALGWLDEGDFFRWLQRAVAQRKNEVHRPSGDHLV